MCAVISIGGVSDGIYQAAATAGLRLNQVSCI